MRRRTPRFLNASAEVETGFICWELYQRFDRRALHNMGLTEPILARTEMPSDRPAHKLGLMPLAEDLAAVRRWWGDAPRPGMYRAAVEAGVAPAWIRSNLASIEGIERKIYNDHDPIENLALAFTFPEKIEDQPQRAIAEPGRAPRSRDLGP